MSLSLRINQIRQRGILILLAAAIVAPFLFSSSIQDWRTVRPIVGETLVLSRVAFARVSTSNPFNRKGFIDFLRTGPNLPVVLLVLYGMVSWCRSPFPEFSGAEWIRLACGA